MFGEEGRRGAEGAAVAVCFEWRAFGRNQRTPQSRSVLVAQKRRIDATPLRSTRVSPAAVARGDSSPVPVRRVVTHALARAEHIPGAQRRGFGTQPVSQVESSASGGRAHLSMSAREAASRSWSMSCITWHGRSGSMPLQSYQGPGQPAVIHSSASVWVIPPPAALHGWIPN